MFLHISLSMCILAKGGGWCQKDQGDVIWFDLQCLPDLYYLCWHWRRQNGRAVGREEEEILGEGGGTGTGRWEDDAIRARRQKVWRPCNICSCLHIKARLIVGLNLSHASFRLCAFFSSSIKQFFFTSSLIALVSGSMFFGWAATMGPIL